MVSSLGPYSGGAVSDMTLVTSRQGVIERTPWVGIALLADHVKVSHVYPGEIPVSLGVSSILLPSKDSLDEDAISLEELEMFANEISYRAVSSYKVPLEVRLFSNFRESIVSDNPGETPFLVLSEVLLADPGILGNDTVEDDVVRRERLFHGCLLMAPAS